MPGQSVPFRNPAGHAGLLENLLSLIGSLAGFFESRLTLIAQEGKTALVHFMLVAGCLVGAILLTVFGYVFIIISVIAGIAHALGISWIWIALIAGFAHFVLAFICLLVAKNRVSAPVFRASAHELRKDREWLKTLNKTNQSPP